MRRFVILTLILTGLLLMYQGLAGGAGTMSSHYSPSVEANPIAASGASAPKNTDAPLVELPNTSGGIE